MPIYHADTTVDENGEPIAVCPECEGSGHTGERDDRGHKQDCPVCCGFGRLDW